MEKTDWRTIQLFKVNKHPGAVRVNTPNGFRIPRRKKKFLKNLILKDKSVYRVKVVCVKKIDGHYQFAAVIQMRPKTKLRR